MIDLFCEAIGQNQFTFVGHEVRDSYPLVVVQLDLMKAGPFDEAYMAIILR